MNRFKENINQLIDKLASLYLSQGIQPSEIADAIFEKQYSCIKSERVDDTIVLIASFSEFEENSQTTYKHQIKYTYSRNKALQVVEHKIGNKRFKLQWSRQEELEKLINEFVSLVSPTLSKEKIYTLLSTLPEEIRPQVKTKLKLVA